jgi:hypothetical protein
MNDRSKRQSFLGPHSDTVIAEATIAIAGLCGGGSHIAQQAAHVGFRRFRLFDPDHVETPNLNRMVGSSPADATSRRAKTDVIHDVIMRIQPGAEVELFSSNWQTNHLALRESTLVYGCLDSFGQRDELEGYCRRFLLPYVDIGMDVYRYGENDFSVTGQVITSLPHRPCMRCFGFITEARIAEEAQRYGASGDRPQVVWPNGVLASTALGIGIALLTPWSGQALVPFIEYDGNRHELKASSVLKVLGNTPCPHYPAAEVGDPFWNPNSIGVQN